MTTHRAPRPALLAFAALAATSASFAAAPPVDRVDSRVVLEPPTSTRPFVRLGEGRTLAVDLLGAGELREGFAPGARPSALAAGDFDEDGLPDLVVAGAPAGSPEGFVAIFPDEASVQRPTPGSSRSLSGFAAPPFRATPSGARVASAPDQLFVGDFDRDGHVDVVVVTFGRDRLELLSGDGGGRLRPARSIGLPGALTTATTGDVDRRDGLPDLVVAIDGAGGPRLLVFESPEGVFETPPEEIALPAPALGIEIAELDDRLGIDLLVLAGDRLLLVHGRDRGLTRPAERRDPAPPEVESIELPTAATAMLLGDFVWDDGHRKDLALVGRDGTLRLYAASSADAAAKEALVGLFRRDPLVEIPGAPGARLVRTRLSSLPTDGIVRFDPRADRLDLIHGDAGGWRERLGRLGLVAEEQPAAGRADPVPLGGRPVAVLPLRIDGDALDDLVILTAGRDHEPPVPIVVPTVPETTYLVTNAAASGAGSLRQAILNANSHTGADAISFAIPIVGTPVIDPDSAGLPLPDVTGTTTIDATGQSGGLVALDGSSFGSASGANGLHLLGADSTVRGMVVDNFPAAGVLVDETGALVAGCRIGTNAGGSSAAGNGTGIEIGTYGGGDIGTTAAADRNLVSGNAGDGILVHSNSGANIRNNLIGTTLSGNADLGNGGNGIYSTARFVDVGAAVSGARNVISGNLRGVRIEEASSDLVQGNYIGLGLDGTTAVGNSNDGVLVNEIVGGSATFGNTIGSTSSLGRNVISANLNGIHLFEDGGTDILGNYVGTDAAGSADRGNALDGIFSDGASAVEIGSELSGARNVISGNNDDGISVYGGSATIAGNLIGLAAGGSTALANGDDGIYVLESTSLTIGGTVSGARNWISGNVGDGISFGSTAAGIHVVGNTIGLATDNSTDRGNAGNGIASIGCASCEIGGATAAERNVISGNDANGILFAGTASSQARIRGNFVGTDGGGILDRGNSLAGIRIENAMGWPQVGGSTAAEGNTISGNGASGLEIVGSGSINVWWNHVGADYYGTIDAGNSADGIRLDGSDDCRIGEGGAGESRPNVLSGNSLAGIRLVNGSTGNVIRRNLIGSNQPGTAAMPNGYGIWISESPGNSVGGSATGGNWVSGNSFTGITLYGAGSSGNVVSGNRVGIAPGDAATMANGGTGLSISGAPNNTIGGTGAQAFRNHVSGNSGSGIVISGAGASGNLVASNYVGTDLSGMVDWGNGGSTGHGIVVVDAPNNQIGSSDSTNLVSGNGGQGIRIQGSGATGNLVRGNVVGLTADLSSSLGNGGTGIAVVDASGNTIGGTSASDANRVAGNGSGGIEISTSGGNAGSNTVAGNFVGTPLFPSPGDGIRVSGAAAGNVIGQATGQGGNTVRNHAGAGLRITGGTGNALRANGVGGNGKLGISLGATDTPTANDPLDGDTGPNLLQNYPVITSSVWNGTSTTIQGTLDSFANGSFTVDLFNSASADPSGYGEGETWLGSVAVTTDGAGHGTFSKSIVGFVPVVTATATSASGNSSELSAAFVTPNSSPSEVSATSLRVRKGSGSSMTVDYTPSCHATTHAAFAGTGAIPSGGVSWTQAACSLGVSGTASVDFGGSPAGGLLWFVLVGQNGSVEGSYGKDSNGIERPEAVGVGACNLPRDLSGSCP